MASYDSSGGDVPESKKDSKDLEELVTLLAGVMDDDDDTTAPLQTLAASFRTTGTGITTPSPHPTTESIGETSICSSGEEKGGGGGDGDEPSDDPTDVSTEAAEGKSHGKRDDAALSEHSGAGAEGSLEVKECRESIKDESIITIQAHDAQATGIASLSSMIVTSSRDGTLAGSCIDGPRKDPVVLRGHTNYATSVAVPLFGSTIASGSTDNTVRVWNTSDATCNHVMRGHDGGVAAISFLGQASVVSASGDKTLRIWDCVSGESLTALKGHTGCVDAVAYLPLGAVCSGSRDRTIRLWDDRVGKCTMVLEGHTGAVRAITAPPGYLIVTSGGDRHLRVWDVRASKCMLTLAGHAYSVRALAMSINSPNTCVSGSHDKTLKLWNIASGLCTNTLVGHTSTVTGVTWLKDGRIASCDASGIVKVWNIPA